MKQKDIDIGNKIIAEFMGLKHKPLAKGLYQLQYEHSFSNHGFKEWINEEMLKFHSSWNWLIPVVKKLIETLPKNSEAWGSLHIVLVSLDIKASWKYVVECIEWYNKNKD